MGTVSQEIMRKAGMLPKLQLAVKLAKGGIKSTGPHKVKFISDKLIIKPPREEGDDSHCVRYVFEEGGVQKQYDTRAKQRGGTDPSYFVQAMAAVEPGEELVLEMKKSGIKNYVEIVRTSIGEVERADSDDDEDEDDSAFAGSRGEQDIIA